MGILYIFIADLTKNLKKWPNHDSLSFSFWWKNLWVAYIKLVFCDGKLRVTSINCPQRGSILFVMIHGDKLSSAHDCTSDTILILILI